MSNSNIGVLVDVETTGLSPYEDEIIEIALIKFSFDKATGEVLDILDTYTSLREPKSSTAIAKYDEAYKIHGIPFSIVKGKEFDHDHVNSLLDDAEYGFAHNSSFDRSFVFGMYQKVNDLKWHCSMKHITKVLSEKVVYVGILFSFLPPRYFSYVEIRSFQENN
jgi:DNA polymerase-3 subunit epsilon